MTAYLAGLALLRIADHPRSAEVDPTARAVLIAMATFAKETDIPECYASWDSIGDRAGVRRRAVGYALRRLHDLGLIEPAGKRGLTVRWRLLLCARDAHKTGSGAYVHDVHTSASATSASAAHKTSAPDAHKTSASGAHKPYGASSGGLPEDDAPPDEDARPPGGVSPETTRRAAEVLGLDDDQAAAWITDKLAGRAVRHPDAYIRAALNGHKPPAAATPAPAKRRRRGKRHPDHRRHRIPGTELWVSSDADPDCWRHATITVEHDGRAPVTRTESHVLALIATAAGEECDGLRAEHECADWRDRYGERDTCGVMKSPGMVLISVPITDDRDGWETRARIWADAAQCQEHPGEWATRCRCCAADRKGTG